MVWHLLRAPDALALKTECKKLTPRDRGALTSARAILDSGGHRSVVLARRELSFGCCAGSAGARDTRLHVELTQPQRASGGGRVAC